MSRSVVRPRALLAFLIPLLTVPACAQRGEDTETRAPAAAVSASPAQLDSLLARASGSRTKGSPDAPVTLIEVSDFQCPFCARFVEDTWPALDSAYVQTGKVKVVFVQYPLPMHAQAWTASEASLCAGAQGAFWPMHDAIFAAQKEWSGQPDVAARMVALAQRLKLDTEAFRACLENDWVAPLVVGDVMQAAGANISGTPSFFLRGPGAPSESNQRALSGAIPFEELRKQIDELLAQGS